MATPILRDAKAPLIQTTNNKLLQQISKQSHGYGAHQQSNTADKNQTQYLNEAFNMISSHAAVHASYQHHQRNSIFLNDKISHKQSQNHSQAELNSQDVSQSRQESPDIHIVKQIMLNSKPNRSPLKGGGFGTKHRNTPGRPTPKANASGSLDNKYKKTYTGGTFGLDNYGVGIGIGQNVVVTQNQNGYNYSYINPLPILGTEITLKKDHPIIIADYDPMGKPRINTYNLASLQHQKQQAQSQTHYNQFSGSHTGKQQKNIYYSDTSRSKQKQKQHLIQNTQDFQQAASGAIKFIQFPMNQGQILNESELIQQLPQHGQIGVQALLSMKELSNGKQMGSNQNLQSSSYIADPDVTDSNQDQNMSRKQISNTMMNKYTSNFPEIHLMRSDNIWQAQRGSVSSNTNQIDPTITNQAKVTYQATQIPQGNKVNYAHPQAIKNAKGGKNQLQQNQIQSQQSQTASNFSPSGKMRNLPAQHKNLTFEISMKDDRLSKGKFVSNQGGFSQLFANSTNLPNGIVQSDQANFQFQQNQYAPQGSRGSIGLLSGGSGVNFDNGSRGTSNIMSKGSYRQVGEIIKIDKSITENVNGNGHKYNQEQKILDSTSSNFHHDQRKMRSISNKSPSDFSLGVDSQISKVHQNTSQGGGMYQNFNEQRVQRLSMDQKQGYQNML